MTVDGRRGSQRRSAGARPDHASRPVGTHHGHGHGLQRRSRPQPPARSQFWAGTRLVGTGTPGRRGQGHGHAERVHDGRNHPGHGEVRRRRRQPRRAPRPRSTWWSRPRGAPAPKVKSTARRRRAQGDQAGREGQAEDHRDRSEGDAHRHGGGHRQGRAARRRPATLTLNRVRQGHGSTLPKAKKVGNTQGQGRVPRRRRGARVPRSG